VFGSACGLHWTAAAQAASVLASLFPPSTPQEYLLRFPKNKKAASDGGMPNQKRKKTTKKTRHFPNPSGQCAHLKIDSVPF